MMEDLQIVVSVIKTTGEMGLKTFEVKVGLKTVGTVYLIPSNNTAYSDLLPEDRDGTRWAWESASGPCSLDGVSGTRTSGSRMEAVYALLGREEAA
jgi:hypothetical protein